MAPLHGYDAATRLLCIPDRNGGAAFKFLHRDRRGDVEELDLAHELLVDDIVMLDTRQYDLEDVIIIPGKPMGLDDLGDVTDDLSEGFDPFVGVMRRLDHRIDRGRHPHLLAIEYDDAPGDMPALLKPLYAARAGRYRQGDAIGKFGDGDAGIRLQKVENLSVAFVKHVQHSFFGRLYVAQKRRNTQNIAVRL